MERIELFIGCDDLVQSGEKAYDAFCVVQMQRGGDAGQWDEVERTETIYRNCNPRFCTSIEVQYSEDANLRFEVYERKAEETETERLKAHEYRGGARAQVSDLLLARGNQLRLLLHDGRGGGNGRGTVFVVAERIDVENKDNNTIVEIDIKVPVLKRKDREWNSKRNLISQRFEIWRKGLHDDEHGHVLWLPIYRSDRVARQRDSATWIEFTSASLKYRHLCNGDEERLLRLVFYGVSQSASPMQAAECADGTGSNGINLGLSPSQRLSMGGGDVGLGGHITASNENEMMLAYTEISLRLMCEMDPTADMMPLERIEDHIGPVNMGKVVMDKAEPTDFGSYFSMKVNYERGVNRICALGTGSGVGTGSGAIKQGGGGSGNGSGGSARKSRIKKMVQMTKKKHHSQHEATGGANALINVTAMNGLFSTDSIGSGDSEDDAADEDDTTKKTSKDTGGGQSPGPQENLRSPTL